MHVCPAAQIGHFLFPGSRLTSVPRFVFRQNFIFSDRAKSFRPPRGLLKSQEPTRRRHNRLSVFHYSLSLLVHELEQIVGTTSSLSRSTTALPAAKRLSAGPCSSCCSAFPVRIDDAKPYLLEELFLLSWILRKHPCG